MSWWEGKMFGEVISLVVLPGAHLDFELAWRTRSDPPKAHIHRFGSFWLDGVAGNAFGGVCCRTQQWWLWPSHFG
jgi:hypothetical protein